MHTKHRQEIELFVARGYKLYSKWPPYFKIEENSQIVPKTHRKENSLLLMGNNQIKYGS